MNKLQSLFDIEFKSFDILYICIGFSGFKMSGDKNFYLDLFEKLTKKGLRIFVISFSDPIQGMYHLDETSQTYPILLLKRPFHLKDPARYWITKGDTISFRHQHNVFQEHFERYISLLYWNKILNHIITSTKPKNIHYIDTFIGTKSYPGTKKIITQASADNGNSFLYKVYLYMVFKSANIGIFFNEEQLSYLPKIITHKLKAIVQPWGVRFREFNSNINGRAKHMVCASNILFLWSGYIQQIGYKDFLFAKLLAEEAVSLFENIEFIFAFKQEINIELPQSTERIRYLKPASEFNEIFTVADIFYSPLRNRETVIGPPLTWIEFISTKRPILTTDVKGLDCCFEKDKSILTFKDRNDFLEVIKNILNKNIDLCIVGENAFKVFKTHFDMEKIAENYLSIY